jgi:hypothetical protein
MLDLNLQFENLVALLSESTNSQYRLDINA